MSINKLPLGYSVRLAIVTGVSSTNVECQFYDGIDEKPFKCPIPHPYAGRGGGILAGIETNTMVLVATGTQERRFIVGIVPDVSYYSGSETNENIKYYETYYPTMKEGEVAIKGNSGQFVHLFKNGNIAIDAGVGGSYYDLELSKLAKGIFTRSENLYSFTEAGRKIEGVVKRNLADSEEDEQSDTIDFLSGETYEYLLTPIGRCPDNDVHLRSTTISKKIVRNPPFIEKRELTYEYADSFNVKSFDKEVKTYDPVRIDENGKKVNFDKIQRNNSDRSNRRTDILSLGPRNYNALIEKVEGTLVDIYGNILDINRNTIKMPTTDVFGKTDPKAQNDDKANLAYVYDHLRRSVKYHFEINSRKPLTIDEPTLEENAKTGGFGHNGKNHSRFSIDIDSEGMIKLNVPSTSETGNIPILARYYNDKDANNPDNGAFRAKDNGPDVKLKQFGAKSGGSFSGQKVENSDYFPSNIGAGHIGTAFHDINSIASSIFTSGKLKSPTLESNKVGPISEKVTNQIKDPSDPNANITPNAGGRSVHANLDGSMEISIGADTVDRKSMVIDLAGGVISHYGRDKNGRGLIQHIDGDVIIQVGGKGLDDSRFTSDTSSTDRAGRVEIHLNRPNGTPQKIIVDENGITIDVKGNAVFRSSGDMTIAAGGKLLLTAELIQNYGDFDIDSRKITGAEKVLRRKGRSNG